MPLAKVKLEDDEGKCHFATMFTNVILSMIENDHSNIPTKLLESSQMVFTIINHDIITHVSKELSSQLVQSSQETGNDAIAAAMGIKDYQKKTWREDPTVE